jgi:hypothetical protein
MTKINEAGAASDIENAATRVQSALQHISLCKQIIVMYVPTIALWFTDEYSLEPNVASEWLARLNIPN